MAEQEQAETYVVGYRKPPVEHQFKKGMSGNPGGRAKKIAAVFNAGLLEVDPDDAQGRTRADVLFATLYAEAKKGNVQAAKEILDRVLGKAHQTKTITDERSMQLREYVERYVEEMEAAGVALTFDEAIERLKPGCPELELIG
jgi:predicted DNA-binding protein